MRACGLLDFQDAQQGHPSYDLVSLIEDARRDVSPAVQAACLNAILGATGLDRAGLPHRLRPDGARSAMPASSACSSGCWQRDGKPDYLPHLPRVWRMFERRSQHEALEPLRAWVDRLLPPPLAAHQGAHDPARR